jgi:hypothetical protein
MVAAWHVRQRTDRARWRDPFPANAVRSAIIESWPRSGDGRCPDSQGPCRLLAELATLVRNTCRTPNAGADGPTFDLLTTPNPKQQRDLEMIQKIRVHTET